MVVLQGGGGSSVRWLQASDDESTAPVLALRHCNSCSSAQARLLGTVACGVPPLGTAASQVWAEEAGSLELRKGAGGHGAR